MTKILRVSRWKIRVGDTLKVLANLPDASVHCCVTSPPYWGLRDYGTGRWKGGDPTCEHRVGGQVSDSKAPGAIVTGQRPGVDASSCRRCGAQRVDDQIGLEATPAEYVAKMVAVFREVRRVLRDDGVLFLNLGDSYVANASRGHGYKDKRRNRRERRGPGRSATWGLKPKDLVGIPWRVAFALQADGWFLRSDIIWAKPNPMPESVTDRPTKAHEYVFLLTKSPRYYYDAGAIAEVAVNAGKVVRYTKDAKNVRSKADPRFATRPSADMTVKATRNRRTVWTLAPQPFKGAHFAVMPSALARLCVLAGAPPRRPRSRPILRSGDDGSCGAARRSSVLRDRIEPRLRSRHRGPAAACVAGTSNTPAPVALEGFTQVNPKKIHPAIEAIRDAWPEDVVAGLQFADGFDDAILGVAHTWGTDGHRRHVVLYDYAKCHEILMEDGVGESDVDEHLEFNVLGSYVGPTTPIYAYLLEAP